MWLLGLVFFIVVSIIFSDNGETSSSTGDGIPYRNRKQIRNFIRK